MPTLKNLHILLVYLPCILGIHSPYLDSRERRLPQLDAPIGIINDNKICYITAFLQIINAVRYCYPDVFEELLTGSQHALLDSYAKTLNNTTSGNPYGFRGFGASFHALDPDLFVRAFVTVSPSRLQSLVFEEYHKSNGTVDKINRGPWRKTAQFGYTDEVMECFLSQWKTACVERNITDPFESRFITSDSRTISPQWITLSNLHDSLSYHTSEDAICDPTRLLPVQARITRLPPILVAVNSDTSKSFVIPTTIQTTITDDMEAAYYKLLAIVYAFPIFSEEKGFLGFHETAIVRYGSLWYLCNDEIIMPFINEKHAHDWIATAHQITYSGPGLPQNGINIIMPHIVVYRKEN